MDADTGRLVGFGQHAPSNSLWVTELEPDGSVGQIGTVVHAAAHARRDMLCALHDTSGRLCALLVKWGVFGLCCISLTAVRCLIGATPGPHGFQEA